MPEVLNRFAYIAVLLVLPLLPSAQADEGTVTDTLLITDAMQGLLDQDANLWNEPPLDRELLRKFYTPREFTPIWVNGTGPLPRAEVLRQVLHEAETHGLDRHSYWTTLIDLRWQAKTSTALARLELLLTDALLRYGLHQRAGQLKPADVDPLWQIQTPQLEAIPLLKSILAADDFSAEMRSLAPSQSGYQRLRKALAHYKHLAASGGWPEIFPGTHLKLGIRDRRVALLRQRLMAEGDLFRSPVENAYVFDQSVKHAVERFQVRYGLKMDGVVGPMTRASMNVPIAERIEQIKLNLERWRWLPRNLGAHYIMVNTAGFDLTVIEHNKTRFTMWVIIGKRERPTPTLTGKMHTIVFNPHWTIPVNLAFKDVIPKQQRDPNYMQSKGIRVLTNRSKPREVNPRDIDWQQQDPDHFPYLLRQDPGPDNPLGRIKFLFSNNFEIYLHDTPKRRLFNRQERTFSSGCIRVEDPVKLAAYILGENSGWTSTRIAQALDTETPFEARVTATTPVYLVYWTAWVGEDDSVYFRPDVYKRDQPLAQNLPFHTPPG